MIVSIKDFFVEISESLEKFMVTYSDQPLFWLLLFCVLLVQTVIFVNFIFASFKQALHTYSADCI